LGFGVEWLWGYLSCLEFGNEESIRRNILELGKVELRTKNKNHRRWTREEKGREGGKWEGCEGGMR